MPSVPQSLLWISLVVLWLFVLVPMLISKREAVRRTSDVALATRVLNSGSGARKRRTGPAAGHNSDPDWQPSVEADLDDDPAETPVMVRAAGVAGEPDILDVEVIDEDSAALPLGATAAAEEHAATELEPEPESVTSEEPEQEAADEDDGTHAEYETVEDTSGLESEEDPPTETSRRLPPRRRLYESTTAAAVSARKYRFRKRVLSVMALVLAATTIAAVTVWPDGWWACGTAGVVTIIYLCYLRRQTRIEERVQRRRTQRMARARAGVQNTADRSPDVPSRLRRPGAAVLEIDDEDPSFEHLDYAPGLMEYHLPRAAGQ
jgi:hypothetical protein